MRLRYWFKVYVTSHLDGQEYYCGKVCGTATTAQLAAKHVRKSWPKSQYRLERDEELDGWSGDWRQV